MLTQHGGMYRAGRLIHFGSPETYKTGAEEAKQRAIDLYRDYLRRQRNPAENARQRLTALERDLKGSNKFDYLCEDYED
jgi:hypothetical protein